MDVKTILMEVNKLHNKARATKRMKVIGRNRICFLSFNGSGFEAHDSEGKYLLTYNTRKITQARQWLKEYLAIN